MQSKLNQKSVLQQFARRLPELLMPLLTRPEKWLFANGLLPSRKIALPDFLGIGAPQSGTTWLYENLRSHPEIFMPERKELRYFEKNFHKSLSLYYAPNFKPGLNKVKGEITPSYGKMPLERIRFIRKIMPQLKLILILRNPVDRVWASTRRAFAKRPGALFEEAKEQEILACFQDGERRANTNYLAILDHWLSVFPKEQLFIAFFEEITNDPQMLLGKVFHFLGVSDRVDWNLFPYAQVINKNPERPIPEKLREVLGRSYRDDIEGLYKRFGEPVRLWRIPEDRQNPV
ncbi:MAG: sulfotransferase [Verrucomicrobiota bacterium]